MGMIRFGAISFINALPLQFPEAEVMEVPVTVTLDTPAALNAAMLSGQLDVSAVSSVFYLRHQSQFDLLPNLSISAEGAVQSVVLVLPHGWEGLTPKTPVWVPRSSETSIALMEYVVQQKCGFKPMLHVYRVGQAQHGIEEGFATLAIGDEALTLKQKLLLQPELVVDLAEVWQAKTHLPFVFGVWVAHKSFAQNHPDWLAHITQLLHQQKERFATDAAYRQQVIQQACQQAPQLIRPLVVQYLTEALSYDLDASHIKALQLFDMILNQDAQVNAQRIGDGAQLSV